MMLNMKREKVSIYLILIGTSLAVHLFVFFDYKFLADSWDHPFHWHIQSYILILISFILSILQILLKRIRLFLLFIKFSVLLLLGYPLGEYLNIETILIASLILESIYYLPNYYGGFLSLFFIIITFFNQKPGISWDIEFGKPSSHQLLFFLFFSFLILSMGLFLKKFFKQAEDSAFNVNRLDRAIKELTDINLDFQNYAAVIEHEAIEAERKRISREMHDIIGYTLTNQLMIIQAVLSMKKELPPEIESLLLQSQKQTKDGMAQARSALYKLREFSPDSEVGIKLIYKLVKTFEQITGINIKIDFCNTLDSFGREIDQVIYRLIQESLTNAFRHGKATNISIIMSLKDKSILISIWDNGKGASKINEGIGLKGMRERLNTVNGVFETITLYSGFTIRARIPYLETKEGLPNEYTTC